MTYPAWLKLMIAVFIALVVILLLSSCYNVRKAKAQFSRAAVAYPLLAADYCATTFPPNDTTIFGVQIVKLTDTLYADDASVIRDTLYSRTRDTVYIHTEHQLPGKIINNTFIRVDTIRETNTAAVDACNIALRESVMNEGIERKEAAKWKATAKKRFWLLLGMGAGIALGIFAMVRRKVVKKISPKK